MKIRAWNIFSFSEVVVEKSSTCGADSVCNSFMFCVRE